LVGLYPFDSADREKGLRVPLLGLDQPFPLFQEIRVDGREIAEGFPPSPFERGTPGRDT